MTARTQARRERISAMVSARGEMSVEEIASLFNASPETIRRDLTLLQDAGALLKVHGGAKRAPNFTEGTLHDRMNENRDGKRAIASKLAEWLPSDQMVFMDTGSTTLIAAEALVSTQALRIVTNSLRIASYLASRQNGPDIFLLGGHVDGDNSETFGSSTIREIGRFNADFAIITIGALNAESGACDYSYDEAEVARAMTARADRIVVLADCSKFDRRASFPVRSIDEIDVLISDTAPCGVLGSALSEAGVHVL